MTTTQYKVIPISFYGFKYYDKILYGKMFMIDNHFHNIYRNYQRFIEIREKDSDYDIIMKEFERKNQEKKKKLLNRIRNEIIYMEKYLMKEEFKQKVLFEIVNENISSDIVCHYDREYETNYILNRKEIIILSNHKKLRNFIRYNFVKYHEILNYAIILKKFKVTKLILDKTFYSNGLEQEEIEKEIIEIIKKFEGYFKEIYF